MHALRHDVLPPSGVEFAVALKLMPPVVAGPAASLGSSRNIVTARSNVLRIYDVQDRPFTASGHVESEREKRAHVRKGTEPVEGEVEMDQGGEGWVNMGSVKVSIRTWMTLLAAKLYLVRKTRLCYYSALPPPQGVQLTWHHNWYGESPYHLFQ